MILRIDSLNNCGLPQLAKKLRDNKGDIYEFSESDIETISNQVKDFDNYYVSGWKGSITRAMLKSIVNEFCEWYRITRYLIKD